MLMGMQYKIKVRTVEEFPEAVFEVAVIGKVNTRHTVFLKKSYYEKISEDGTPEELIERSFEFLLEREPNTSILPEFDLSLISEYFPEFEEGI